MSNNLKSLRFKTPDDLREKLSSMVTNTPKHQLVINLNFGGWFAAALGLVATISFLVGTNFGGKQNTEELLTFEVANSHIRSMMEDHIFDVASTDQHTVKPWFGGKLDFSPSVIDLADVGYPLVGGRLDYISARPAAAIVYKRDQHKINLFTWPSTTEPSDLVFASSQGFNVWHWSINGMAFYAVSDLNANSLKEFAEKLREKQ